MFNKYEKADWVDRRQSAFTSVLKWTESQLRTRLLRLLQTSTLCVQCKGNVDGWAKFDRHCGHAHGVTTPLKCGQTEMCLSGIMEVWVGQISVALWPHLPNDGALLWPGIPGAGATLWTPAAALIPKLWGAPVHFPGCAGYSSTSVWDPFCLDCWSHLYWFKLWEFFANSWG